MTNASTESMDARVATLEQQTEWLAVELERMRTVMLSMAALVNEGLLPD